MLFDKSPSYDHLRVFGSLCFMTTAKHGRDKFQYRGKACVFIGYPFRKKGYRVMEFATSKFYESRDSVFHENIFPFAISTKDGTAPFIFNPAQNVDATDDGTKQAVTQNCVNEPVQSIPIEVSQPLRRSTRQHKLSSH